jgi:hypothetical protein
MRKKIHRTRDSTVHCTSTKGQWMGCDASGDRARERLSEQAGREDDDDDAEARKLRTKPRAEPAELPCEAAWCASCWKLPLDKQTQQHDCRTASTYHTRSCSRTVPASGCSQGSASRITVQYRYQTGTTVLPRATLSADDIHIHVRVQTVPSMMTSRKTKSTNCTCKLSNEYARWCNRQHGGGEFEPMVDSASPVGQPTVSTPLRARQPKQRHAQQATRLRVSD